MKKNGKKYRKLQREKEQKKSYSFKLKKLIDQEVDDIHTSYLAISQIIVKNPVIHDSVSVRNEYLKRLNKYIRAGGWEGRKFESAQLRAYKKIILECEEEGNIHDISFYKYFVLLDIIHILNYDIANIDEKKLDAVKNKYYVDFPQEKANRGLVNRIFNAFCGGSGRIKNLLKLEELSQEWEYIGLMLQNNLFRKKEPVGVMVTATMSAGKSTFINALTGKYICHSQNMACTSKIHSIINKAFEDGFSYEYDHDLVLTAGREELVNDNELNTSYRIVVGTYFNGNLSNQRIIISDSPGVNFSGDAEHKEITDRLIKGRNYHLLIYVMNATQLGTNDESEHLEYVKRYIGRTPIIFIMNKIDAFNTEEENIQKIIENQRGFLEEKGFKKPCICPMSARAGYLSKQFVNGNLSRIEKRELYAYVDKFTQMGLPEYYAKAFGKVIEDADTEEEQLYKTSGLAYVEKIIISMYEGRNKNGSGIR